MSGPRGEDQNGYCTRQRRKINQRTFCEPIPRESHLATSSLNRVDVLNELQIARESEVDRHRSLLHSAPPKVPERSGGPWGAANLKASSTPSRRSKARSSTQPLASRVQAEEQHRQDTPARPRRGRLELTITQDPCDLPNRFVARTEALSNAIEQNEAQLARSRSEFALRTGGMAEVRGQRCIWDHRPPDLVLSEQQAQFFPRSLETLDTMGGGKDRKLCRPFDAFYIHREAFCKQKNVCVRMA